VKPPAFSGRTLADRAFEWLEEAIIKGDFPPETRLDEGALAQSFGISRGPVREAIRRLEGKRLVERVPHIGARVAAPLSSGLIDALFVREALEGMACRLACTRMTDKEIDDLEELLENHASELPLKRGSHYYQRPGDYDFHFRIILASGNETLIHMVNDELYYQLRIYRYRSSSRRGRTAKALEEHRSIIAALRSRDPDQAEAEMRRHLVHAREAIKEELPSMAKPKLKDIASQ
jgi:DNA-binding GntR family transcriptional regulator